MTISPKFNGIFTIEEHTKQRKHLIDGFYEAYIYLPPTEDIILNIDSLRSQQEIDVYFREIFAFWVKNNTVTKYYPETKERPILVTSRKIEKLKWAQYSIYNSLMIKPSIYKTWRPDCLFPTQYSYMKIEGYL